MKLLTTAAAGLIGLTCALSARAADTKVEFHLAETKKADGLTEAQVQGSDQKIYLHRAAILGNADIAASKVIKSGDSYSLALEFTAAGAKKLARATAAHVGKPLAVLIDGKVVSAPVLREKISAKAVISGNFTKEELDRIARGLK